MIPFPGPFQDVYTAYVAFEVLRKEKRPPALKRCSFGCLQGLHALNVTNGCGHRCVYCYARGYRHAPPEGQIELYVNLPDLLAEELDKPRRRVRPSLVVFNTASDCFQPHPEVQKVTYRTMEVLLKRGIRFSFLTKGTIPRETLELLSERPELVRAQVGLVSLSRWYWKTFEQGAASPEERLRLIEDLQGVGIRPEVRIDPIIPFVTDAEADVKALLKALKDLGVKRVSMSYLHLRPAIADNLKWELGKIWTRIELPYRNQPWRTVGTSTRSKLVPLSLRRRGYERIKEVAHSLGIEAVICSCKNPDLEAELCIPPSWRAEGPRQLSLF